MLNKTTNRRTQQYWMVMNQYDKIINEQTGETEFGIREIIDIAISGGNGDKLLATWLYASTSNVKLLSNKLLKQFLKRKNLKYSQPKRRGRKNKNQNVAELTEEQKKNDDDITKKWFKSVFSPPTPPISSTTATIDCGSHPGITVKANNCE